MRFFHGQKSPFNRSRNRGKDKFRRRNKDALMTCVCKMPGRLNPPSGRLSIVTVSNALNEQKHGQSRRLTNGMLDSRSGIPITCSEHGDKSSLLVRQLISFDTKRLQHPSRSCELAKQNVVAISIARFFRWKHGSKKT